MICLSNALSIFLVNSLPEEQDSKLVEEMREQGKAILPEIEDALDGLLWRV